MRLFAGLPIPRHIVSWLDAVVRELKPTARLNWSPPQNLHITVRFIGEWPDGRFPEIHSALTRCPKPNPFTIDISCFGFFPNPHRPRTFFAGVHAGPELATLAKSADDALDAAGSPSEKRAYSPHVTLARIKNENIVDLRERIAAMTDADTQFGSFEAGELCLYRSKTGPAGSLYSILASYPLGEGISA
jgi:2'-5' RNA ligase